MARFIHPSPLADEESLQLNLEKLSIMRTYEGRYEFRRLCCSDRQDVWEFLDRWKTAKENAGQNMEDLDEEIEGIHEILKNCSYIPAKMAGVLLMEPFRHFRLEAIIREKKMEEAIRYLKPEEKEKAGTLWSQAFLRIQRNLIIITLQRK